MNTMKFWTAIAMLLAGTATWAQSQIEQDITITLVGTQGNQGYIAINPPPLLPCAFNGLLYIQDLNSIGGVARYATALRLRGDSRPASRIDYTMDSATGICSINLIDY